MLLQAVADLPVIDTPPRSAHLLQLYDSDDFLSDAVGDFIADGLVHGEAALIIATDVHREAFKYSLMRKAIDVDKAVASGQLLMLDAASTLSSFCVDGKPDRELFFAKLGRVFEGLEERAEKNGRRLPSMRAYGEMVGLLWADGDRESTLKLEGFWNELAGKYSFSLLCGYVKNAFHGELGGLHSICKAHTHTLPEEGLKQEKNNSKLNAITLMREQAGALLAEKRRRTEAEGALKESEAFKNLIVDSSPDCIKILDLDARILFMNEGGIRTVEIDSFEAVRGASWVDFWKGDEHTAADAAFAAAKAGGLGNFTGFFPSAKTQAPKWWSVVLSPMRDHAGEIRGVLAVSRDITERKLLEQELRLAIRTRDEFLSIASHELKTPITTLKLQAQLKRKFFESNDARLTDRHYLGRQIDASNRQIDQLSKLVDDMLDISRIAHGRFQLDRENVELGGLVRDVLERFDDQLKAAGCRYTLTTSGTVSGSWDRYRLEQVFVNLLTNVIKYAAGKPVEVRVRARGPWAELQIQDSGPGIEQANLERVFNCFERANEKYGSSGLGLGLYISRQIVDAHGGKIWVESDSGLGAAFTAQLPLA